MSSIAGHALDSESGGDTPYSDQVAKTPARNGAKERVLALPQGPSEEAAYTIGAFLGSIHRYGSLNAGVIATAEGQLALSNLQPKVEKAFEIKPEPVDLRKGKREIYQLTGTDPKLRGLLDAVTAHGTQVPWEIVITPEERRALITGFLDFARVGVSPAQHRLHLASSSNPEIIKGLAVLLKMEGVYPSVECARTVKVYFDDTWEIRKLREFGLITNPELDKKVEALASSRQRGKGIAPEIYDQVKEIQKRNRELTPSEVLAQLETSAVETLPSRTEVAGWLRGSAPMNVQRCAELTKLQNALFDDDLRERIGRAIISRLGEKNLHPLKVARALNEFWGGYRELSRESELPALVIQDLVRGSRIPTTEEYIALIFPLGLKVEGKIAEQMKPPDKILIHSWLKRGEERGLLERYESAVVTAGQEAWRQQLDPKAAVFRKFREISARYSRIGDAATRRGE